MLDWAESERLAAEFNCQPRECFSNALKIAKQRPDLMLVRGELQRGTITIEHAWLLDKRGRVLDPTLALIPVGRRSFTFTDLKQECDLHYKDKTWDTSRHYLD